MKKSLLKTCSMVFAAVSFVSLVVLICFSVTLPYTESYRVWGTLYTQHYAGYFDTTYLSSMILLAFGTFWGLVIFFALPCEKCKKECTKKEDECSCCSSESVDESAKSVEQ